MKAPSMAVSSSSSSAMKPLVFFSTAFQVDRTAIGMMKVVSSTSQRLMPSIPML